MLHFNELKYSKDNKYIIIDVAVDSQDYYENIVIDSIVIDNQDTYISNGPSSTPIYIYQVLDAYDKTYSVPEECSCGPVRVNEDESYCFTYGLDTMKHVRLELPLDTLGVDLYSDILFVYVIATGTPAADTPCGFDNSKIMGTVVNLQGIYNNMLSYIRQVENNCSIPKEFIDSILRFKAIEVGIKTGNYPLVIKYWKKFFSRKKNISVTTNCGCYE